MPVSVTPFLMFEGAAEDAVNLYISAFEDARIALLERYECPGQEPHGRIKRCDVLIAGQRIWCFDSPIHHGFTFTPAASLFVECGTEQELDDAFTRLSEGGKVLMPVNNYGFSRRYAWLCDRFGVSWQLNIA